MNVQACLLLLLWYVFTMSWIRGLNVFKIRVIKRCLLAGLCSYKSFFLQITIFTSFTKSGSTWLAAFCSNTVRPAVFFSFVSLFFASKSWDTSSSHNSSMICYRGSIRIQWINDVMIIMTLFVNINKVFCLKITFTNVNYVYIRGDYDLLFFLQQVLC